MTDAIKQEVAQPRVLTNADLKQYLNIYHNDLPIVVVTPSGELVGILDVTTVVYDKSGHPRNAIALITTKATTGKTVPPVIFPK